MSDIHLGHPNTPTSHIVANLNKVIRDEVLISKLDFMFLAGDVFDRLLNLPEEDVYLIRGWAKETLVVCGKYGVALRILEGTPRHDRRQSRIFDELVTLLGIKVDMRYVDVLEVEVHERTGASILYIPDEWRHHASDTLLEAKQAIAAKGLEKVDFAVMHGMFEYQLPEVARRKQANVLHDSTSYLEMVRYYIFIGHNHHFSQLDRIVSHGSFDRLAHGYEDPKGYVLASVNGEDYKLVFVENTGAMIYKTVDVVGLEAQDVPKLLDALSKYPEGSYFRFRGRKDDHAIKALRSIREQMRGYNIQPDVTKGTEEEERVVRVQSDYVPMHFSESSIRGQILEYLKGKGNSDYHLAACERIIDGYLTKRLKRKVAGPVSSVGSDLASA